VENFGILAESFSENVTLLTFFKFSEFFGFPKNWQVCVTQFFSFWVLFGGSFSVTSLHFGLLSKEDMSANLMPY
jgi:hypothetical protein